MKSHLSYTTMMLALAIAMPAFGQTAAPTATQKPAAVVSTPAASAAPAKPAATTTLPAPAPAPSFVPTQTTAVPAAAKPKPALVKVKKAKPVVAPTETLTVEGVRAPAWIAYANGVRDALIIGGVFNNGEKVITGPGARVELKLADGSAVKLGENATLNLSDLAQTKTDDKKNLVTASLDVLVGAFRFTTGVLAKKYDGERDVQIHLVTMTAGIRGTDVWGKAADDGQTLALIDGDITVVHDDGSALEMDKPMTMYQAPTSGAGAMVALTPEHLKEMALETEIVNGQGASERGGHWKVYVGAFDNPNDALALYDKLRIAGYGARIFPTRKDGGFTYHVRIPYLPTQKEAQVLAQQIKDANLVTDTKIAQN